MGANTISITQQTAGISTATLTLGGLTRNSGSTVNFTNTNGTLGTIGSNPQILLLNNNTLTDNILGGGFVVNGGDWASYNPTFGVGGLSTTGFAGYSPDLITSAVTADNISMATTPAANLNNTTIDSLASRASTIAFNAGQGLTLTSGGLLLNANTTLGSAVNNGTLTSGGPELFLYANSGTSVINSQITGSEALVKSGAATTVTLAGTNNYTGGTYVDQGTLTLGATGALGTGGIFLNGGTLVETAGGVIPSQAVNLTGAGVLTLAGANSLTSLTFNNTRWHDGTEHHDDRRRDDADCRSHHRLLQQRGHHVGHHRWNDRSGQRRLADDHGESHLRQRRESRSAAAGSQHCRCHSGR